MKATIHRRQIGSAATSYSLALHLHQQGQLKKAERKYKEAIGFDPYHFDALHMLGILCSELGRHQEGAGYIEKALRSKATEPSAWSNLSVVQRRLGQAQKAVDSCERAIDLRPDYADAFYNRGNALKDLAKLEDAVTSFNKAISLQPRHADAYNGRGLAFADLGRFDDALSSFRRAIDINPHLAVAHYNSANAHRELGHLKEALKCYDEALKCRPEYPEALFNRANVLLELRRPRQALISLEKLLATAPDHPYVFDGLATAAILACDWDRARKLAATIGQRLADKTSIISPFIHLSYSSSPELQLKCARKYIGHHIPSMPEPLWRDERYDHDRLRVAYISSDFRNHPMSQLIVEMLERHDRTKLQVIGICTGIDDQSSVRSRIIKSFDQFHQVSTRPDAEVAQLIRTLEVDVAVDLNGYTSGARPHILAYRPAPSQVHYMGFPATMGCGFIDYLIADETVVPPHHLQHFTERIVYMPDSYWVNDSKRHYPSIAPSRATHGLPDGRFVFCCFNATYKISSETIEAWSQILTAVPSSVLWLLSDNADAATAIRQFLTNKGIAADRVILAERIPTEEHLARHLLADVALDCLPVNAHTTAADALWMGVPVLTCLGTAFSGRVAASLLRAAGLPELVTNNWTDYKAAAVRLATEPGLLDLYRNRLMRNRLSCALFDTARFTKGIEAAYHVMTERSRAGKQPESFKVGPLV